MTALELARQMPAPDQVIQALKVLEHEPLEGEDLVIYVPGLGEEMLHAGKVLETAARLVREGNASRIAVSGTDGRGPENIPGKNRPKSSWIGVLECYKRLRALGIDDGQFVDITEGPQLNSLEETEALLEQAKKEGWRAIIMVTLDYHRVRQALGAVKQMEKSGFRTRMSWPSFPLDWDMPIMGSQNVRKSTCRQEARIDWCEKIHRYQAKGDLASLEEFKEYIMWRDAGPWSFEKNWMHNK